MSEIWISDIYTETKNKWEEYGEDDNGFAIFYSPVIKHPKIMIIGYNPGGGKDSFNRDIAMKEPLSHEYIDENYKLARNMKLIFDFANLSTELINTVKLNLIFFRSKKATDFDNKKLIQFCTDKVKIIINNLQPRILITEGIRTYKEILKLLHIKSKGNADVIEKGIIKCVMEHNLIIIGLRHPSGSWGISEEMLRKMGHFIEKQFKTIA